MPNIVLALSYIQKTCLSEQIVYLWVCFGSTYFADTGNIVDKGKS